MCFVCGSMSCAKLSLHWLYTFSQAKGTKSRCGYTLSGDF